MNDSSGDDRPLISRRAARFDPSLQDDIAPSVLRLPLMDGARPRDFADPVPEVTRSRWWAPVR